MAQASQMQLYKISICASKLRYIDQPAFRFRYTLEKVVKEPARTARYAKGTASPTQSMSNIMARFLFTALNGKNTLEVG